MIVLRLKLKGQEDVVYTYGKFLDDIFNFIYTLKERNINIKAVYGIPKGGLIPAVLLANRIGCKLYLDYKKMIKDNPIKCCLVIDDISDSGKTLKNLNTKCYTCTMYIKEKTCYIPDFYFNIAKESDWLVFPWE